MLLVHQALCHMHKKQRAALLMFLALSPMVGCKGRSTRQKPPILPAKAKRIVTSDHTSSAVTYPAAQALSSSSSTAKPARWPVLERIESLTKKFENKGNSPAYLFDALQKLLIDLSAYKDDFSFTQDGVATVNACMEAVCNELYDIDKKAAYQALCRCFFGVEGRASIKKVKPVLPGSTLDTFLRLLTTSPGKPKRSDIEKLITKLVGYVYYIACSDDNPDMHDVLVESIREQSGRISSTEPVNSYVDLSHLQDSKEYEHRFYPFKAGKKGLEIDKKAAPFYAPVERQPDDSPQPVALPEEVVQPTEEPEEKEKTPEKKVEVPLSQVLLPCRLALLTAVFENEGKSPVELFDALQTLLFDLSTDKDDFSFTQDDVATVNACIRAVFSALYDVDKKAEYQALCRRFFGIEDGASIKKIEHILPGSTLDIFLRFLTTSPGKPKRTDIEKLATKFVSFLYGILFYRDKSEKYEFKHEIIRVANSTKIRSRETYEFSYNLLELEKSKEYEHRFYLFKAGKNGLEIDKNVAPLYSAVDIELYDSIRPQPVALPKEVVQPTEEPEEKVQTLGEVGKGTLQEALQLDTTAKTSTLEVGGQIVTPPRPGSYEELCTRMRNSTAFKAYLAPLGLDLNELTNDIDSPGRTEALVICVRKLVQTIQSDPEFTKQKLPKGLYAILLRMIAQLPAEEIKQRTEEVPASLLDNLYQAFRKQKRNIPIPMVPSKKFANYADQLDLLNLAIIKSRVKLFYELRADKTCGILYFVYKHYAEEEKRNHWLDMGLLSSKDVEYWRKLDEEAWRTLAPLEGL